jgi:uncharacterized protein (TIGR03663 family)
MSEEIHEKPPEASRSDIGWLISCIAITAVATALRFVLLGLKPFHHDEGVNGWFLTNLFRDGEYKYDPANYHGPTLYYISLAFTKAFGLETVPVRWSVAIWGVLIVVLAFFLRRYIGRVGALMAASLLALSPGMVFISRYFIHEIFFVFLSLAFVISIVLFIERKKAGPFAIGWMALILLVCFAPSTINIANSLAGEDGSNFNIYAAVFFVIEAVLVFLVIRMLMVWNDGRPIYFLLAAACVALLFATKETAFITLGTMAIAAGCVWMWRKMYKSRPGDDGEIEDSHLSWANFREALGTGIDLYLILLAAFVLFAYIGILFFSSFFTYSEGIGKAFEAYNIWTKTGSRDHADNGLLAYFKWAMKIESPIVLLSAFGTAVAFYKARHRFAMFAGLWTLGLFLAYTIIPYKTPWLALSFLLPACLVAGYGINEIARAKNTAAKPVALVLAIVAFAVLSYQTYEINFVRYDDDKMPYVYAHTRREFMGLVADIERYAAMGGKGPETVIDVVSPDYWPLVWYVKDYPKAAFHGRMVETAAGEIIVAKKGDQNADVIRRYSANYEYVGVYDLRPGVELVLMVRKDLAGSESKELYRLNELK